MATHLLPFLIPLLEDSEKWCPSGSFDELKSTDPGKKLGAGCVGASSTCHEWCKLDSGEVLASCPHTGPLVHSKQEGWEGEK